MIKKLKTLLISLVAVLPVMVPLAITATAHAEPINCGVIGQIGEDCPTNPEAESTINRTIKTALNLFSGIVGIISVVMVIVGGVRYITSGGDSGKVASAQNTVLYAVIGLVVVALAQIIVQFVLKKFTN